MVKHTFVLLGIIENTVHVNVENIFDLRYATRSGRDAREFELAEKVVAARHLALTLVYLSEHTRPAVEVREDPRLLVQDNRVAPDKGGHLPIDSLDTDGEG